MRRVTAAEAFLLQLAKHVVDGDSAAARASLTLIEHAMSGQRAKEPLTIVLTSVAPGSVTSALDSLRMAIKLDPCRATARMALEPCLVEVALARLPQQLTAAEQRVVLKSTRTPQKVRLPQWWSEYP